MPVTYTNKNPNPPNEIPDAPNEIPDAPNEIPDAPNEIPSEPNEVPNFLSKHPAKNFSGRHLYLSSERKDSTTSTSALK